MEKFFKLKQHGTNIPTEVVAGATTFFAMAYIIFVNPDMLSLTGMPRQAVFLATVIASIAGTLMMGLFANVPYAQAPGMGLNAFFTFTVVFALGFSWQEALAMVFLCGIVSIIVTVTRLRKLLIKSIPESLQHAIGGGIGVFIAYIGIKNAGLLKFTSDPGKNIVLPDGTVIADSSAVPELVAFNNPGVILALIGIILTFILVVLKVKGAIMISIIVTTIIGIPMGVSQLPEQGYNIAAGISTAFNELGETFGAAFGAQGIQSLFADAARIPLVLVTIFAFSLTDIFDTIGTFIGTGKKSGIFENEDEKVLQEGKGFKSKMDRALFSDFVATIVGAICGTSNVTTYVESAAGISVGGRTGLTSVVTSIFFALSILFTPFIGIVPTQATAPALIVVGIMMLSAYKDVNWSDLEEAIPCFFAAIVMAFVYSISYGIAGGFIFYCLVKVVKGKAKEVHPVIWVTSALFIINFIIHARVM